MIKKMLTIHRYYTERRLFLITFRENNAKDLMDLRICIFPIKLFSNSDLKFAFCQFLSLRGSPEECSTRVAGHTPVVDPCLLHAHVTHCTLNPRHRENVT